MRDILIQGLSQMGLEELAQPQAVDRLCDYARLLLEKNQVMNLTAITQPDAVARLHFLDSAAILAHGGDGPHWLAGKTAIDVGTGAGFPGLVLKILEPSLRLTLLDSLGKRVDWLKDVCKALSLDGVECLHARAEEQANLPGYRDSFDLVTSRAVASLPQLTELCLPYARPGGVFIAMKSVGADQERSEAQGTVKRLGGAALPARDYLVPGTEVTHRLILVKKTANTPKGYPRKWAKIKKEPLIS